MRPRNSSRAIALDPGFPRAHYYLGITYLLDEGQSKTSEALEEFKLEVAANPDEFFANYYLGVVYNFQRQWDLAITFCKRLRSYNPIILIHTFSWARLIRN